MGGYERGREESGDGDEEDGVSERGGGYGTGSVESGVIFGQTRIARRSKWKLGRSDILCIDVVRWTSGHSSGLP